VQDRRSKRFVSLCSGRVTGNSEPTSFLGKICRSVRKKLRESRSKDMKKPRAVRCAAAFAFMSVLISTLPAQKAAKGQVVITVVDRSEAIIQGAHIGIIGLPNAPYDGDWQHYALHTPAKMSALTDVSGKASLNLATGSYVVDVSAVGFRRYLEKIVIRDGPIQTVRAELLLGGTCSPCLTQAQDLEVPLARMYLPDIVIPPEPLESIGVRESRFRRRLRF
jgi:hypothetical protein